VLWRWAYGRRRVVLAAAFLCIGIAEAWHPTFGIMPVPWTKTGVPPVYDWLGRQPGPGAVVELPIGDPLRDVTSMVHSSRHWRPLVNGYSGFAPTTPFFRTFLAGFPSARTVGLLHDVGVRWVVVHRAADRRNLCDRQPVDGDGGLRLVHDDPRSCVLEIVNAPPSAPIPADRELPREALAVAASDGSDASAALDDKLSTHWTQQANDAESWLRIDLSGQAAPHVSRVVIELGPHYGEYLHRWRLEGSLDGSRWASLAEDDEAVPPLVDMRMRPSRLATELRPAVPTEVRSLRIVSVPSRGPVNAQAESGTWGVHEVRVYATQASGAEGAGAMH